MFIAQYQKGKVFKSALVAAAFVACGVWMALRPDGAFDGSRRIVRLASLFGVSNEAFGRGVGWTVVLFGCAFLPVLARQLVADGPAIRIDADGVYWRRWSPDTIRWSNIARFGTFPLPGSGLVCLTLKIPALNPSQGVLGWMAGLNAKSGWGHVPLSAQGTDRSFKELHDAVRGQAELHARLAAFDERAQPAPTFRGFGRRR